MAVICSYLTEATGYDILRNIHYKSKKVKVRVPRPLWEHNNKFYLGGIGFGDLRLLKMRLIVGVLLML
jgi:hypothetical protein